MFDWFRDWWVAERGNQTVPRPDWQQLERIEAGQQQRIATLEQENREMAAELKALRRLNARMIRRVLDKLAPAPVQRPAPDDPLARLVEDHDMPADIDDAIARRAGPTETALRNNLIAHANRRLRQRLDPKDIASEILNGQALGEDDARMMEDLD